ncbi:molybdate ABC transporter substrate-binding protein [Marinobacter sp. HL-58]|uniref:molybdate ABC transporter substrate-binding protein n=1 Tax=Marinobacter sp. HL-58 TaxID=1479237 RepID=UPI00068C8D7C|nr:molybdate ABC transporter substrate-binding protein [Marinobacter sp. HL-58]KPQ02866.1 MAG: ABC-type molybdenum uptake system substrate-binding component ModA [Marinobacter sp. HL-58]
MKVTIRSLLAVSLLMSNGTALAGEVRLAIAANFHDAAESLAARFEDKTGHNTRISYGSTGKLYAQIRHGAPFDVFLAADQERPRLMEKNSLGVPGTRFTYAEGKLVLWSPDTQAFEDPETFLKAGDFRRLAIANPRTAPYGLAARQTLEHLGLWASLEKQLVRGESIAQTFQFVATGNAHAGFVAQAQLRDDHESGARWDVPDRFHDPISQQAILLVRGLDNDAAGAWLDFLASSEARDIIRQYGYDIPQATEQPMERQ